MGCSNVQPLTWIHSRFRCIRDWLVHSNMPGCWLLVSAASAILFRINWQCVNQVFHVCSFLVASQNDTDLVVSGMMAAHSTSVHVNCFWYLWHTWRVVCFEEWTQTLTSVHTVLKLTSTWIAWPGLNLPTFTWHTVQHMAMAGKHGVYHKQFSNSVRQDYRTFASVCCGI